MIDLERSAVISHLIGKIEFILTFSMRSVICLNHPQLSESFMIYVRSISRDFYMIGNQPKLSEYSTISTKPSEVNMIKCFIAVFLSFLPHLYSFIALPRCGSDIHLERSHQSQIFRYWKYIQWFTNFSFAWRKLSMVWFFYFFSLL